MQTLQEPIEFQPTLLPFDDNLLMQLSPIEEMELGTQFDQLLAMAAEQPDDELVFDGIRKIMTEAKERGDIDSVMQMAMTLGAMACLHSHMQNLANEAGKEHIGDHIENQEHNKSHCADCQAGRPCSKRKH